MKYRGTVKITGWAYRNGGGNEWQWTPTKTRRWLHITAYPLGIIVRMRDATWTGRGHVRKKYGV